ESSDALWSCADFPIAALRRSCDAGDRRALSSHASRIAGAAELKNGTAVCRLPPGGTGSSPQRSQHADCHLSTPSRRSARPTSHSRPHNHQAGCPLPLPITRTSCHVYRLPGRENRPGLTPQHRYLDEKGPQDSREERVQTANHVCQVTIV